MSDASTASDQTRPAPAAPQLLDHLRGEIRVRHYSLNTEVAYVDWCKRYIRFHGLRHPAEMGAVEVTAFLTNLAVERVGARRRCRTKRARLGCFSTGTCSAHGCRGSTKWCQPNAGGGCRIVLKPHTLSASLQALSANAPWPCHHRRGD